MSNADYSHFLLLAIPALAVALVILVFVVFLIMDY